MLTDASNVELDRINALAQERRAQAGRARRAAASSSRTAPTALSAGDEVIFTASLHQPGQPRVENGTLGTVTEAAEPDRLSIETRGASEREVHGGHRGVQRSAPRLRPARLQGAGPARSDRAFVLTGGWQTDRERAYVALTRARERTDIYVSREDLGEQGMDAGAIERLAEAMAESHAQEPSIVDAAVHERESEVARLMRDSQEQRPRAGCRTCSLSSSDYRRVGPRCLAPIRAGWTMRDLPA